MEVNVCTHRGYGYVKCAFLSNVPMFKKNPAMSFAIFGNFWTALLPMKMQNIARSGKKVT